MTIKIWQSYSCNNSSSYRLVARFADAATARDTAAELEEFFDAQAMDPVRYRGGALFTLAKNYGFDWRDNGAGDDGPHAYADGEVLVVWQSYGLGLGPGVDAYLTDRGALTTSGQAGTTAVQMSILFRSAPGVDPRLDEDLDMLFAQITDNEHRVVNPLRAPWSSGNQARGRLTCFRDAGTVGLQFPVDPEDLPAVKAWIAKHGLEAVIRLEEPADEQLFEILAAARCTACNGLLEYLDPRLHDIEMPQLVCKPCGGLYDLSAFTQEPP